MHASEDRGHLLTEQANPRSSELDTLSCSDLVNLFISEDLKPQQAVAAASMPPQPPAEVSGLH